MGFGTMQFMSHSLGRHVTYSFIVPDQNEAVSGPFPVLYQLHGASDDHSIWLRQSNIARHVQGLPLIVVFPDGALSYWINHNPREMYEDFLTQELPEHVRSSFHAKEGKAAIGGLSMGGYGSMYQALKHPEQYCSVWSHSSAFRSKEDMRQREPRFWPADIDSADIFALASEAATKGPSAETPVISFDCGTEDFLLGNNRRFHEHLEGLGLCHTYREHPGDHSWPYWDAHIAEAIDQHCRVLGLSR